MKSMFCCLILFAINVGCVSRASKTNQIVDHAVDNAVDHAAGSKVVSVLTYNVENLFDTDDDPDKDDDAFLPQAAKSSALFINNCNVKNTNPRYLDECLNKDWSPARLDRKLSRLTDVVGQVNFGRGPDILIVEEVESRKVLELWRDKYMKAMGYTTLAYLKGPDERGINPAVFSRLPILAEPKLHEINFDSIEKDARPSRGLLEVTLKLPNGDPLTVFAVHLPSQGAPTPFRRVAVDTLMAQVSLLPENSNILVGGDFNISAREEAKEKFFKKTLSSKFAVSHLVGCKECAGTIYYPRDHTWSFFDVLLFNKGLREGLTNWRLDPASIHIVNSSIYQMRGNGTPSRFGSGGGATGVSDHWPMYAELHMTSFEGAQK